MYQSSHFSELQQLGFFCSGMGSGKSNIICNIPAFLNFTGITFLVEPNEINSNQIIAELEKRSIALNLDVIRWTKVKEKKCIERIYEALEVKRRPVIVFDNLGKHMNDFTPSAKGFIAILRHFKQQKKLVLIDEIDSILTCLTGGINAKLDRFPSAIEAYTKVCDQSVTSLNIFDEIRKYGAKTICFSGTANNVICSKLPSTGYALHDIDIINVYPIELLYRNLLIKKVDVHNFDEIMPYLLEHERIHNSKILCIFPEEKAIDVFEKNRDQKESTPISSVRITSKNKKEHSTADFQRRLQRAKYIFTIEMARTGFNLSTHCVGQEFSLGILFRKLSDTISQPLSKNYDHELHLDSSAGLLQSLARLREGGTFLIHNDIPITSLHEGLQEVYEAIERGKDQSLWVGNPRTSQKERCHQGQVLNLIQNIQESNRPTVQDILDKVKEFDQRDFEAEYVKAKNPSEFDSMYWIEKMGIYWDMLRIENASGYTIEEKEEKKKHLVSSKNPVFEAGGGERTARTYDQRILDEVKHRANGICAHCGRKCRPQENTQIAHIHRFDSGGSSELDNLVYAHKACDSAFDDSLLLHDPAGGYWLDSRYKYKPDRNQLAHISPENIHLRWEWAKQQSVWGETLDEEGFRRKLVEFEYEYSML